MSTPPERRHRAARLLATLSEMPPQHPDRARVRAEVIEAWLPLAHHLANRFAGRGEPREDLDQTAIVGLIKAVNRYDADRGVEFVAYAIPTIAGEIKRHFRDRCWDVRVPRRLQEMRAATSEATTTLTQALGRSPTVAELARHLDRGEEEILEGLEAARAYSAVSLSAPAGEGETPLSDLLGADDEDLETAELRVALGPALAALDPREQRILTLRFYGNLTQSQIAERVGISQMHVSRILARALAKLRGRLADDF
ncbi:hypothetical protein JCM9533A_36070 [Catenuloplanes niger JCM 9533]|uniref:RNA polymerase sigma-B factor n=2 Tax=Micromonosporaceae TaxID=28056 RepID=A0AAE3ZQ39_9ACTN|nr:RNA polymerase sigma-B factor [Catenuloplanes niger]